jgi:hypothetical protein
MSADGGFAAQRCIDAFGSRSQFVITGIRA